MLAPARPLGFVLYGGTAIALQLGHRQSIDFDFFSPAALDKATLRSDFAFMRDATIIDDGLNTLVVSALMPSGPVKVSFFGHIRFGHVVEPRLSADGVLSCAQLDDLLATKLKTILDRAEAKDYRDIAAMLESGVDLARGLAAFRAMFGGEPRTALMAIGYFDDGDVAVISPGDKRILVNARDAVRDLPEITVLPGLSGRSPT